MKKMVWFFVIIPVLFISFHPVQAEEKKAATDGPWERGSIRLGAFLATGMSSDVTFGIEDIGLGIVLDMEDALGLDSSMQVLKGDLLYRFGSSRRHNFSFAWSSYHRDATKELQKDREINGKPISVGTDLHSKFNFEILRRVTHIPFFTTIV